MSKYEKEMEEVLRGDDIDPIESSIGRWCMEVATDADEDIKERDAKISILEVIIETMTGSHLGKLYALNVKNDSGDSYCLGVMTTEPTEEEKLRLVSEEFCIGDGWDGYLTENSTPEEIEEAKENIDNIGPFLTVEEIKVIKL
jgi:hypothetical protein